MPEPTPGGSAGPRRMTRLQLAQLQEKEEKVQRAEAQKELQKVEKENKKRKRPPAARSHTPEVISTKLYATKDNVNVPISTEVPDYTKLDKRLKIREAKVLDYAIEQSRISWLQGAGGMFRKYWTRPPRGKKLVGADYANKMSKFCECEMVLGPHTFEVKLFLVEDNNPMDKDLDNPVPPAPASTSANNVPPTGTSADQSASTTNNPAPTDKEKETTAAEGEKKENTENHLEETTEETKKEAAAEQVKSENLDNEVSSTQTQEQQPVPKGKAPAKGKGKKIKQIPPTQDPKPSPAASSANNETESSSGNGPLAGDGKPHVESSPQSSTQQSSNQPAAPIAKPAAQPAPEQLPAQGPFHPPALAQPAGQTAYSLRPPFPPPGLAPPPADAPQHSGPFTYIPYPHYDMSNPATIQKLQYLAQRDPPLNSLMRIVAGGSASVDQINRFKLCIDRAEKMPTPPEMLARLGYAYYPATLPQARHPAPPKSTYVQKKSIKHIMIVFEFKDNPNGRFVLPKEAVLEMLPSGDILWSFLALVDGNGAGNGSASAANTNAPAITSTAGSAGPVAAPTGTVGDNATNTGNPDGPNKPSVQDKQQPKRPKNVQAAGPPKFYPMTLILKKVPFRNAGTIERCVNRRDRVIQRMENTLKNGIRLKQWYVWFEIERNDTVLIESLQQRPKLPEVSSGPKRQYKPRQKRENPDGDKADGVKRRKTPVPPGVPSAPETAQKDQSINGQPEGSSVNATPENQQMKENQIKEEKADEKTVENEENEACNVNTEGSVSENQSAADAERANPSDSTSDHLNKH